MEVVLGSADAIDDLLGSADAIDDLLEEAMCSRTEAVRTFKKSDKTLKRYQHASMYRQLSRLPKSKVHLYEQLCKSRDALKLAKAEHERAHAILRSENRGLRQEKEAIQVRLGGAQAQGQAQDERIRKLQGQLLQAEGRAMRAQETASREKITRESVESELRKQMQAAGAAHSAEMAACVERLRNQEERIELQADALRAAQVSNQVSELEHAYGILR